jgi:hypothetical protein
VYRSEHLPDHRVIAELAVPLNRKALARLTATKEPPEFELLSIPAEGPEETELVAQARIWSSTPAPTSQAQSASGTALAQLMTFQGAQLLWGAGRAAIVAPAARLAALEAVLVEMGYYEAELCVVESQISAFWPNLEADGTSAFQLDERTIKTRGRMQERFHQLLGLRARLTRLIPLLLTPYVYPPTLASQLSERLRERLRMRHRVEVLQEQLEVFERIYDACGQRASDYTAERKTHVLEMIIIVLLGAQTLLALFEILTRMRK